MTDDVTACKEQKSTTRDEVEWCDCCSLHVVASSVIYYSTHTRINVIYLFYTIFIKQIQIVYQRIFLGGARKKKNKSADVIWRGFDVICVCPLIDHGQQPMKMHTEVTLLYKLPFSLILGVHLNNKNLIFCFISTLNFHLTSVFLWLMPRYLSNSWINPIGTY